MDGVSFYFLPLPQDFPWLAPIHSAPDPAMYRRFVVFPPKNFPERSSQTGPDRIDLKTAGILRESTHPALFPARLQRELSGQQPRALFEIRARDRPGNQPTLWH